MNESERLEVHGETRTSNLKEQDAFLSMDFYANGILEFARSHRCQIDHCRHHSARTHVEELLAIANLRSSRVFADATKQRILPFARSLDDEEISDDVESLVYNKYGYHVTMRSVFVI